ncbi:hypothetical protein H0H93_006165 [Arthromyces matolae]|nr:hypothetical protein H0H93_006165 [Arthromyces matolae]
MGVTDKRTDLPTEPKHQLSLISKGPRTFLKDVLTPKSHIAPDIRGKFRDAVTPKQVAAAEPVVTAMTTVEDVNEIEDALSFTIYPAENTPHIDTAYIEDMDDLPDLLYPEETPTASTSTKIPTTFGLRNGALVVPNPYDIYLRTLPPGRAPKILNVTREAESLRAIMMVIDGRTAVESIVNSGSQIIAMSEEYDPTVKLNMQSANSTIDSSLGIARNTLSDDDVLITITDPNTDKELIPDDQGDTALILDFNSLTDSVSVESYADISELSSDPLLISAFSVTDSPIPIPSVYSRDLTGSIHAPSSIEDSAYAYLFLTASNLFRSFSASIPPSVLVADYQTATCILGKANITDSSAIATFNTTVPKRKGVQVKKKYKPVALQTKPVGAEVPDEFRIERNIIGDPLKSMPTLNPNPPLFIPTGRFTDERMKAFVKAHDTGFLTESEINILTDFMCLHNRVFA